MSTSIICHPEKSSASALTPQPANMPKRARQAIAAASFSPRCAMPVPADLDSVLLGLLPDDAVTVLNSGTCENKPFAIDNRDWLPDGWTLSRDSENRPTPDFGPAPDGLSAIERVLWSSVGRACARGALFLYHWLGCRKYMRACELSGSDNTLIQMLRVASPVYFALFDRVEVIVRAGRTQRTEDTLHDLANGAIRKTKVVSGPDGVVTTDEGAIYDVKAAALELQANSPDRYRPAANAGTVVAVQLNISVPQMDDPERVAHAIDADDSHSEPSATAPTIVRTR